MLKYEFVSREWIISRRARTVYRSAAVVSVALFFALCYAIIYGIPEAVWPFEDVLLLIGALGAGITLVGMEFFLFRFDDSRALAQVFWFLVMVVPFLGAPLYCFFGYSRSAVVKASCAERAEGVGAR